MLFRIMCICHSHVYPCVNHSDRESRPQRLRKPDCGVRKPPHLEESVGLTSCCCFSNSLATCHGRADTRAPTCFPGSRPGGKAERTGECQDGQPVSREEGDVSGPGHGSLRKLQHHPPTEVILSSDLKVILPAELKPGLPLGIVEQTS